MKSMTRLFLLFGLACLFAGCSLRQPSLTRVTDKYFVVTHPLVYKTNDGTQKIEVPIGFLTDLASIPSEMWWFVSPFEGAAAPAIIHDYLYWTQACTKPEADLMMAFAMHETGLGDMQKEAIYFAIRKSSKAQQAWEENTSARKLGESRFLSVAYTRKLQNAPIRPGLQLSTVYKEAGPGGVLPSPNDPRVKQACNAAVKFQEANKDL